MPRVALTFDDGPGLITAELLDVLRDASWPATFFVLGRNVDEAPWAAGDVPRARALVQRELAEGHVVGHHTYSHAKPDAYRGFAPDFRHGEEVVRACRRDAGWSPAEIAAPVAFRLPYGVRLVERTVPVDTGTLNVATVDPRLPVLASLGRTHVHWTADFADWAAKPQDGADIASRMLAHVDENAAIGLDSVICLHDGGTGSAHGYDRRATLEAVRDFVHAARRRGGEPFTVPAG